jgi:hypothetical protein
MAVKKIVTLIGIIFVLVLLADAGGKLYFEYGINKPYQRFRSEEEKTIPLFDALNENISSQIPIPPGVVKLDEHQGGLGGAYHGRFLWIDYRIPNTTMEQVSQFYEQFMPANGWERYGGPVSRNSSTLYYRGTGCFEINMYDKEYHTIIEHDYFRQTFSLALPELWIIQLNEFGETNFAHCPPSPGSYP